MREDGMVVIVMGIAGSGKTTVGQRLAEAMSSAFIDADDYHSEVNRLKMRLGKALDDQDRAPWLAELRTLVAAALERRERAVLACSALKESYRKQLRVDPARVPVVYLKGNAELIERRLRKRVGHYATELLLQSQLATLEEPKDAIEVDAAEAPEQIVNQVMAALESRTS